MNLPNKLTVLRVIMVPFFVFFMLTDAGGAANKWIALVLYSRASCRADHECARGFQGISGRVHHLFQ